MNLWPSRARTATVLALIALLTAACGAAPANTLDATPEATPDATTSEPEASETADATPEPTEAELSLPDDVSFESTENSTITAVASFDGSAEDGVAISIRNVESDYDNPLGFAALLLEGTCAEQTEPDFEGAIDVVTFDQGENAELLVSTEQLGEILASPHSILITNGPGDLMLACADIGA
ncbi:MAG: hypothetical protein K5924_02310 [Chloroflexi bacterium]|nr:hypothetical protein [Chloroflexota bacterium]